MLLVYNFFALVNIVLYATMWSRIATTWYVQLTNLSDNGPTIKQVSTKTRAPEKNTSPISTGDN